MAGRPASQRQAGLRGIHRQLQREDRRTLDDGRFRSLVVLYKGSDAYKNLAPLTRRNWAPWLDRKLAGLDETGLHFHDLRGTAATRFYTAGLSERAIAEIMGWEEEHVAKIIRRYVGRAAAATRAI